MFERYKGLPERNGKYKACFYNPDSGAIDDIRFIWLFPEDKHYKEPWSEESAPMGMDYMPLPGTTMEEWQKEIRSDEGVIQLLEALIERAKIDAFGACSSTDRATALWFLDTAHGREWYQREKAYRCSDEYQLILQQRHERHAKNVAKYQRYKEREREKRKNAKKNVPPVKGRRN